MSWGDAYVLAAVPLAVVAVWWIFRPPHGATGMPSFANIKRLWAARRGLSDSVGAARRRARGVCLALGALCALAALARPQWGTIEETTFDQSREIMIALDLSRSMLADDVNPTRLARAKLLIESLLEQLQGERIGLIVFSGTAFVQSPLSADYEVMRDLLKDLDPSYLPEGGTDYGAMLRTADNAFGQTGDGDRFLVVLSDGEAHDDAWRSQVAALKARGIRVIGLGIGTAEGAVLPDGKGGLLKDDTGGVVLSRLEPRTLQQLAEQTHGVYRDAAAWVDIAELLRGTVDQGVKGQYVEQKQVRQQERFQWFLAPAILFFLLSYWIELPVFPAARALRRPRPATHDAAVEVARAAALLLSVLVVPRLTSAAAAREPNALETTVAQLSTKPALAATDCARLAQQTIYFASKPSTAGGGARIGVIDDALTAVNVGEATDAHAADWLALRKRLEELKQAQQQPPQEQKPQESHQQQQSSAGGQQQDQPNQQNAGQGNQPQHAQRGGQSQNDSQGQPQSQNSQAGEQRGKDGQRSEVAGQPNNNQHAEDNKNDRNGGSNGKANDEKQKTDPAADGTSRKGDMQREVAENKDHEPLASADAGLGKLDAEKPKHDAVQNNPGSQPATRMVGGGRVREDVPPNGDRALAAAVGKMARVKDGDAPAVLFERMRQADNPQPPRTSGKNW